MDWLLVGACMIMAWALLLVFSGERARRVQEQEIEKLRKEAEEKTNGVPTLN
jgi:hypothetical protein